MAGFLKVNYQALFGNSVDPEMGGKAGSLSSI